MPAATAPRSPALRFVAIAIGLLALAGALRFTPLRELVDPDRLARALAALAESPLAPLVIAVAYGVLTFLMVPVNALILATGLAFGPWLGAGYALIGALTAASLNYGAGKLLGRRALDRVTSPRAQRLSAGLARRGVLAVIACRLVPIAPFGLMNMLAGASPLAYRDFLLGTTLGMTPGILLIAGFGHQLGRLRGAASPRDLAIAIAAALLLAAAVALLGRWLRGRARGVLETDGEPAPQPEA